MVRVMPARSFTSAAAASVMSMNGRHAMTVDAGRTSAVGVGVEGLEVVIRVGQPRVVLLPQHLQLGGGGGDGRGRCA